MSTWYNFLTREGFRINLRSNLPILGPIFKLKHARNTTVSI